MVQNASVMTSKVNEWISPHDLEQALGIKISTQNKMRMEKRLPFSKLGKKIFYSKTKINQLLLDAEVL